MSLLAKLKFTSAVPIAGRPTGDRNALLRTKMITGIEDMKKQVQADISGTETARTRTRYIEENGQRVKREMPVRARRWFFQTPEDTWATVVRYGTSTIDLGGGTTVEAGPQLADLIKVYDVIIEAVKAGELDAELKKAAVRRRGDGGQEQEEESKPMLSPGQPVPKRSAGRQAARR